MQALIGAAGQPYTQSLSRADLGKCSSPFLDSFEASEIDRTGFMGTEAVCRLVPLGACPLEFINICWVFRWSSHTPHLIPESLRQQLHLLFQSAGRIVKHYVGSKGLEQGKADGLFDGGFIQTLRCHAQFRHVTGHAI